MTRALHIFIILAIALAGASPACKFISGQEQQAEAAPCAHHAPQDSGGQEQAAKDQCAFCFNTAKIKIATAAPVEIVTVPATTYLAFIATADTRDEQRRHYNFRQRGPPAIL